MATKSTTVKLTEQEQKYQRKVKAMELAIKATVGKNGSVIKTVINSATEIYKFLGDET